MQGATCRLCGVHVINLISIHAPYAGGDASWVYNLDEATEISIHAPYAGGDERVEALLYQLKEISIHAPYAGGDLIVT